MYISQSDWEMYMWESYIYMYMGHVHVYVHVHVTGYFNRYLSTYMKPATYLSDNPGAPPP